MKRRVLHVIYSLYRGGAERLIETTVLISGGGRYEYLVCALAGGDDLAGEIERAGAKVFLLEKRRGTDMRALPRLSKLIRRERIDILHLHNPSAAMWGTFAASRTRPPIVRTEHSPFKQDSLPRICRPFYGHLVRRSSRVICVCENVRESYIRAFPAYEDRFVTILNGIRTEPFENLPPSGQCRETLGLPTGVPLVGTVGRLVPVKNHMDLIEAFYIVRSRIPDAHLAIAGEGELKEALMARSADLGLSGAVTMLPPLSRPELFYGALDLFALSSLSEGLPLTLLEALAARVPVVSTRVGGIPEIIKQGWNGYMVSRGSPAGLAEHIERLLGDPEQRASIGEHGRETVMERFTARRMVESVEQIYEELCAP
jgi:glycosyltransferase involved in cell wall biosynthesis